MFTSPMRILALAVLLIGLLVAFASRADALPAAPGLDLVAPAACPSGGCAAGQRLDFTFNFNLSKFDFTRAPNVQVCVFAPVNWSAEKFEFTSQGAVSHLPYTFSISQCNPPPSGYYPSGGAIATLPSGSFGDGFSFSFRLGTTATTAGSVLVEVFEKDNTDTWSNTGQALKALTIAPLSSTVYVANDAAACGASSPCYVNSLVDLPAGFGTGLKDAIDAAPAPATINLLGAYAVKQNTVLVNQPHTLKGSSAARITYSGAVCSQPLLQITAGALLSGLSIDDGACSGTTNRDLVVLQSAAPVRIENSDLVNGNHAIHAIAGNTAAITVTSSHLSGNAGYAILLDSANTGLLNAYANNLNGNRSGAQVECNGTAKGNVDHNFWGAGVLIAQGASQCTAVDNKRLGAPILRNSGSPGTQAVPVTVNTTAQSAFNSSIGFLRGATGSDFGLMIVNHGQGSAANVPFTTGQLGSFNACSNYWDIFLTSATQPSADTSLELRFKYALSASCIATIESSQYCGQTADTTIYPLWWYDLSVGDWKTTGAGGSPTTCLANSQEIKVTISGGNNRPSFSDLARQPFVVGLPGQSASVTLTSLVAQPGDSQATIRWTTTREISLSGFYIQQSTSATTGFTTISPLLARQGTNGAGADYQYPVTNLTNNTPYYFRLLIVGLDGRSSEIGSASVTPFPATSTPTLTPSITSYVAAATSTYTLRPTSTFTYRTNTPTRTRTLSPTSPFQTITNTLPFTATSLTRSATASPTARATRGYPVPPTLEASTALAETRSVRTQVALLSATPIPPTATPTPSESERPLNPLTLVMAGLALLALVGGTIFLIFEQRAPQ